MASEERRNDGQTCQATPQANGREAASERGLDVAKLGRGLAWQGFQRPQRARNALRISQIVIQPRRSSGSTFVQVGGTMVQACKCPHGVVIAQDLYKVDFHRQQSWAQFKRPELSSNDTDFVSLALA